LNEITFIWSSEHLDLGFGISYFDSHVINLRNSAVSFQGAMTVYQRGIRPTNYMQTAINEVTPKFTAELEEAGVQDIEQFFNDLSKIKVS